MRPYQFFLATILILLFSAVVQGQKSFNEIKKELRSLDGSAYLTRAFEGAEILASNGKYKESLDILDKAIKEARGLGPGPQAVVFLNKADVISRFFPKQDQYLKEIIESLDDMVDKSPPTDMIEKGILIDEAIRYATKGKTKTKLENQLINLRNTLAVNEQQLLADSKDMELKEFKKLNKEEAFEELEKLKSERERLETLQQKLSASIDRNERQLSRRSVIINQMSQEQAKKEAIIQYNKRMIDSLRFIGQLDSLNMLTQEGLINEQEAQLQLQESQIQLKDSELQLKSSQQKLFLVLALLGLIIAGFLLWAFFSAKKTNKKLALKNEQIEQEKERSEALLLNILPKYIAQELKEHAKVKTRTISQCTVVFTDFINFSQIAKKLTPQDLIGALDECFRAFDNIISKYNIEKIKTIGDSYMCAGGVPVTNSTHAVDAVNAAIEMIHFLDEWNLEREKHNKVRFDARIGIHSGPIIAGVVGAKKFAYDIWGDTVNVAARLESQSAAQKINISDSTYQLIKKHYQCIKRGSISVKNMTDLEMYFVDEKVVDASLN